MVGEALATGIASSESVSSNNREDSNHDSVGR